MHRKVFLGFCFVVFLFVYPAFRASAQEFNCNVSLNYQLLTGNDFSFLDELRRQIDEYINERSWTDHKYQEHERINCSVQVTIEEAITLTSFRARLVVATRRPIYGTMQSTPVVQFNDSEWTFNYSQGTPLVYDLDRYDPLTSVIDFYVYLMLGYDYDTFSELGGTLYFQRARRIAERAQASGAQGWAQVSADQGRYQLIQQLLDQRFVDLRRAYYQYHFEGLDRFVREPDVARETVLSVLASLDELRLQLSRTYAGDLFFSSKYQELPSLFENSNSSVQAYQLLSRVDPAHLSEYNRLTQ